MFYWIPADKLHNFEEALKYISEFYPTCFFANDMLVAMGKNLTFMADRRFAESFSSTAVTEHDKSLVWRLHVLAWAANHATHIPGDFVECGVLHGLSSAVVCKYLDFAKIGKTFYLYDTFSGLPEETSTEAERKRWNSAYTEEPSKLLAEVRKTFAEYPNVKIVPGIVPGSFEQESPQAIAYLHIDMNSARAELLALEGLFDRVSPGGLIIFDDFGWVCNREQTVAELKFMHEKNYAILELPTGQGLVLKR
jgi:hypothetical protein